VGDSIYLIPASDSRVFDSSAFYSIAMSLNVIQRAPQQSLVTLDEDCRFLHWTCWKCWQTVGIAWELLFGVGHGVWSGGSLKMMLSSGLNAF